MPTKTIERSTFQNKPAYWYIREADKVPTLDEAYEADDPLCTVKLFDPTGSWSWFVAGYDPESRTAFGVVHGCEKEAGDFSIAELVEFRGRMGLPIERDLHYTPKRVSELLK